MPFKIIRDDITRMHVDAIVNTANEQPTVGTGCDYAIYQAAGYDQLLAYRKRVIGAVPEGEVFYTPAFHLHAKRIIHAVSPLYIDGNHQEEEKLRSCYRKSLRMADSLGCTSIAFPLISTGGFGYPKEEGMRIAVDEIHAFLLTHDMLVYLVVFGEQATKMGTSLQPDLEAYIDRNYVEQRSAEEYGPFYEASYRRSAADEEASEDSEYRTFGAINWASYPEERYREAMKRRRREAQADPAATRAFPAPGILREEKPEPCVGSASPDILREEGPEPCADIASPDILREEEPEPCADIASPDILREEEPEPRADIAAPGILREEEPETRPCRAAPDIFREEDAQQDVQPAYADKYDMQDAALEELEEHLAERLKHRSDTFQEYLLFLIQDKGLENTEVYKRAIVDKKVFSKIKNNRDYHPQKRTALCLCVGAKLNLDESRDLLARAGYALSPCDKTDIIFSYFIENGIYDMIELDIQLEEHGLPCIITL